MTEPRCSRLWAAEAVRDGRLTGVERAAFERHLKSCADCTEEAARLEDLARALRELRGVLPDPVSNRRNRQALLSELNAAALRRNPMWGRPPVAIGLLVAVVLASLAVISHRAWHSVDAPQPAIASSPGSAVHVSPEAGARWSLRREGKVERLRIDEGSVRVRIQRSADERIVLIVPDGEIEDRGTVLSVCVRAGHTERVTVDVGAVVLRLTESPERLLRAGQTWSRIAGSTVSPPPEKREGAALSPETNSSAAHAPPAAIRPGAEKRAVTTGVPAGSPLPSSQPASSAPDSAASPLPPSQTAALVPDPALAEDEAYLTVMNHLRAGRTKAAQAAARDYLTHFPGGFRAPEIRAIAK